MKLTLAAQGLSNSAKFSIRLYANPTEIVLLQPQDLRLFKEFRVDFVIFHLGQEVFSMGSESWKTTNITIIVYNRIQIDRNLEAFPSLLLF